MPFYAVSAMINLLSSVILGVFVLLNNRRAKTNTSFALFAFTVATWSFGYYFWQTSDSAPAALWWSRFLMAGAIFIPVTYLHFVYSFLGLLPRKRKLLVSSCLLFSVFFVLDFTPLFVNRIEPVYAFAYWPLPGPVFHVFLVMWFAYVLYSTYLLYGQYRRAHGALRHQIAYILLGMSVGFTGGATNFFLWYRIPIYPVANVLVSVYVACIAYAIVKHHLMNIKVIAAELFSGLLLVVSFVGLVQARGATEVIAGAFSFLVTVIFVIVVVRSVFLQIRQREQVEALNRSLQKTAQELAAANKELARLDQAKSEFLSIASHQLRTPLTVINGYISMILDGSMGPVPDGIKSSLERAFESGKHLIGLVENLLDITRIEAGKLQLDIQPVDLNEIILTLITDFQGRAKAKGLSLVFQPEPGLPKASADPEKIREVITNLIDNAIKYTEHGSVTITLRADGQSVVFACQDTGMGVAPEVRPRLFGKFVRGTGEAGRTKGTGLGLYFARMVVESMNGRIWAESNGEGKGSTFQFSLPAAASPQLG